MKGQVITDLTRLDAVDPPPHRIGFVGASRVGKSTMLSGLADELPASERTDRVYAEVITVNGNPPLDLLIVDGAGQQFSQQFIVIDISDSLIIFVDHDEGGTALTSSEKRLALHDEFLGQLLHHFKRHRDKHTHIHFVLNKRDVWEVGQDSESLKAWFLGHVKRWEDAARAPVTYSYHSNFSVGDMTVLKQSVRAWGKTQ